VFLNLEQGKEYIGRHLDALKKQVVNGDPFVFLGAFSILNRLGSIAGMSGAHVLHKFANYTAEEANVVSEAGRLIFNNFTLTATPVTESLDGFVYEESGYVVYSPTPNPIKKVNLSHKDRDHKKRKDYKLTISASAFIEDVEGAANAIFSSFETEEQVMRATLRLNDQPLIGHGN
jgi:hypothetical protein